MKMIKLSEDHYIVVDDSEIKEGDYCTTHLNIIDVGKIHNSYTIFNPQNKEHLGLLKSCKKITYSTQPLGFLNEVGLTTANLKPDWTNVEYLPLSEVKELLGVVDVEKKGEKKYPKSEFWVGSGPSRLYDENAKERRAYIEGYKEALEDNKEWKYTEEDMRRAYACGKGVGGLDMKDGFEEFIQSLQPKTEWQVEMVDGKLKLKQPGE